MPFRLTFRVEGRLALRLSYLIVAHKNAQQVVRLVDALHDDRDRILVHLDRKASTQFRSDVHVGLSGRPNVSFLPSRRVGWGSWSQCQVELDAIGALFNTSDWDYFINLSGQDFPLKRRREIVAELAQTPAANYIGIRPLSECPLRVRVRARFLSWDIAGRGIRLPLPVPLPKGFALSWKGSQWHVLSRQFCRWLITSREAGACIAHLRHVWIPDEFLMQCLIMNSPFASSVAPDLRREIVWTEGNRSPDILTMRHAPLLMSSNAWFARKFDSAVDGEILELLARRRTATIDGEEHTRPTLCMA